MRSTLLLTAVASLLFSGCGGGGGAASPSSSTASVSASLIDGPFRTSGGTVSAVNIAVSSVQALGAGAPVTIATFNPSQKINLLNYQTSPLQLGTGQLPAGTYSQLRFVLDTSSADNTSVVVNGTTYPLTIPSATGPSGFGGNSATDNGNGPGTAGVKVNVSLDAQAGQSYGYVIDFNAAESIVSAGNSGTWMMKPVLVATSQALAGAIAGTIQNNAGTAVANAQVVAEQGTTIVNSGVTDANGNFQINALPAGSYTLVINNGWTSQAGAAQTATGADGTAAVTVLQPAVVSGGQTTTVSLTD